MKNDNKTATPTKSTVHTSVRIDSDIYDLIHKLAEDTGEKPAKLINQILGVSLGIYSNKPLPIRANIKIA